MSFSYSGDPSSSAKDQVRFLIGDVDPSNPYLSDEEINFIVGEYNGNAGRAAVDAVMGIIATLAGASNEQVGNVSLSNADNLARFQALLTMLQRKFAGSASVRAFGGGISRADKIQVRNNPDRVVPSFSKGDPADGCGQRLDSFGIGAATGLSHSSKSLGDWEYEP